MALAFLTLCLLSAAGAGGPSPGEILEIAVLSRMESKQPGISRDFPSRFGSGAADAARLLMFANGFSGPEGTWGNNHKSVDDLNYQSCCTFSSGIC